MLTLGEIQAFVRDHITYKPGWTFQVYQGLHEDDHIVIHATVENSYQPGEMVELDIHSMLPPQVSYDSLRHWLRWRLKRIEVHEMREWLKEDGKPIFDPHAPLADRDMM